VPTVVLLTCADLPLPDLDTGPLAEALTRLGASVQIRTWDDPGLLDPVAELLVLRTPWDYFGRYHEFLATIERYPTPLVNPPRVVRWNSHKGYLCELAGAGIPVVPTVLVTRGAEAALPHLAADEIVIKPAVGGGARGIGRFASGSVDAAAHFDSLLTEHDVLVQPFMSSVRDGERSLFYFGGVLSHAVHKIPADGDYRVQWEFGGRNQTYRPTTSETAVAAAALAAVPGGDTLAYARVDLIPSPDGPLVMELELIEPELFLPLNPGSADRFAAALLARC
jgi:glutathione synthase/RimK-type ligase-like ATP-grasp enzyme